MLNNLKISKKLILGFGLIIIFNFLLAFISINYINTVGELTNKMYNSPFTVSVNSLTIKSELNNIGRQLSEMIVYDEYDKFLDSIEESKKTIDTSFPILSTTYLGNPQDLDDFQKYYNDLLNSLDKSLAYIKQKDYNSAKIEMEQNFLTASERANKDINNIVSSALEKSKNFNTSAQDTKNKSILTTLVISAIILLISIIITIAVARSLIKPIKKMVHGVEDLTNGIFVDYFRTNRKDELGILSNKLDEINNTLSVINQLIEDIKLFGKELVSGNIYFKIDDSKYNSIFREAAVEVNNSISNLVDDMNTISKGISLYSDGDFSYDCPKMPGEKEIFTKSLNKLKNNLVTINNNVNNLVDSAKIGDLNKRIDTATFNGEWKNLTENMNDLLETISKPLDEVSNSLKKISKGDLNAQIENTYEGKFYEMAEDINITSKTLKSYIGEISDILNKMANQDLNIEIKNEYLGDFANIKKALEYIVINFNSLIGEIINLADQVASGSKQIAQSSSNLAAGATEQSNAIEQLNSSIKNITEKIEINTKNAKSVSDFSQNAKINSDKGNIEMNNMLEAMQEIDDASKNISTIIKTIEDIAFQTNILSLNAAVESARAGEHGKGFAVVAEEVRNLAARSQTSAKESTALIEASLSKVSQGIEIADRTAKFLKEISEQINQVSDISSNVMNASEEQYESITQISQGIGQISTVIQTNTATSEESAAASEELASQSEVFKDIVSKFELKFS